MIQGLTKGSKDQTAHCATPRIGRKGLKDAPRGELGADWNPIAESTLVPSLALVLLVNQGCATEAAASVQQQLGKVKQNT